VCLLNKKPKVKYGINMGPKSIKNKKIKNKKKFEGLPWGWLNHLNGPRGWFGQPRPAKGMAQPRFFFYFIFLINFLRFLFFCI
jgi:hypothetical protein